MRAFAAIPTTDIGIKRMEKINSDVLSNIVGILKIEQGTLKRITKSLLIIAPALFVINEE